MFYKNTPTNHIQRYPDFYDALLASCQLDVSGDKPIVRFNYQILGEGNDHVVRTVIKEYLVYEKEGQVSLDVDLRRLDCWSLPTGIGVLPRILIMVEELKPLVELMIQEPGNIGPRQSYCRACPAVRRVTL